MMRDHPLCFLGRFIFAAVLFSPLRLAMAEELDLLIVAGQSNAVGYDAKPGELPSSEVDRQILFWWRTGDPPPDVHDSTSGGRWTQLQAQPLGDPQKPRQGRQYGNFAQAEGGFGPEIGLARTLQARIKKRLAVIKVAFSGTSIPRDWDSSDQGERGACYRALVSETKAAMDAAKKQGLSLRPRALAWIQGESDANQANAGRYGEMLGEMLQAVRRDLQAPQLISLVAVNTKFGGGRNRFMPTIVQQQQRTAAADPRCTYVDTSKATIANGAHFDSKGTLEVGRLLAHSLLRTEADLAPGQEALTIVTLGDSITKGVRGGVSSEQTFAALLQQRLVEAGKPANVVNVGIGGERTDQALKRLDSVLAHDPDLVTIMYGTNDSYVDQGKKESRISEADYRENLNQLVVELLRRGVRPVLMTEPRWSDEARPNGVGENPNIRLEPYVVACRETAAKWRVPLVDHFAAWTEARKQGVNLHDWTTDGCHPNPAGHEVLANLLTPVVRNALGIVPATREKLLKGQPVRIVCFGDSVTGIYYHTGSRRAYADMLQIALQRVSPSNSVEVINAGISGHTTVNALARIDTDVLALKPDLVTVMFGLNDMTRVPLEQYRANLKKIVSLCRESGAEVVLATPNNVIDTSVRPTSKLIQYCDAVRETAAELKAPLCDVYRELDAVRAEDPFVWRLLMSDAIHPNMAGHQRLATTLAQTISRMRVSLENEPPNSPAISNTLSLLRNKQPVRILAMGPAGELMGAAIREHFQDAEVELETWPIDGLTLAKIEDDAKTRVRKRKPDLVVIAVDRSASAPDDESFVKSYAWIMNWSLNFGPPTWDCVVVHPSVLHPADSPQPRDELIRRLVAAQDLSLIDRLHDDNADAGALLNTWLKRQIEE